MVSGRIPVKTRDDLSMAYTPGVAHVRWPSKDNDKLWSPAVAPTFGAINLEDISAPRCFEIEAPARRTRHSGVP
jgi:malic enzyme